MKKVFSLFFACMMIFSTISADVSAAEIVEKIKMITGFETFDINENALNLLIEYKPSLEEVTAMMPETLGVYLNHETELAYIDVDWFCVAEDYEESDNFYFQFSPEWNKEEYALSEEIDLLTEAPYIAVFFRTEESGVSTYAVTNNSNEAIIFKYLTQTLGYNTAAACGAMANIFCESSFIPNNLQDSYEKKLGFNNASYTLAVDNGTYKNFVRDTAGYGLGQWTYYTRKQGLLDFAKSKKTSIGDITMQLEFLGVELAACATGRYMKSIENSATGAYDVGYYYCQKFERPAQQGDNTSVYRGNLAKNTYWAEYGKAHTHSFGAWSQVKAPTYTEEGQEKRTCDSCGASETRSIAKLERPVVTDVFTDVEKGKWYVAAVQYVYDNGMMSGSKGLFLPMENITRAQLVSTLYRLAGSPEVTDFKACEELTDVVKGEWYANAVCWAYNTGVGSGNSATKLFQVNSPVTRQQLASFFYRFAEYKGIDTTAKAEISGMLNADKVSTYAEDAVKWAVGCGIISGSAIKDENGNDVYNLNPAGTATRAQLASILQRFCENNQL